MSAKKAAAALLRNDADLAAFVDANGGDWRKTGDVLAYVKDRVMGTWTLTMVAEAVECSEQQVVAALLYQIHTGSTCVCRGQAATLFGAS